MTAVRYNITSADITARRAKSEDAMTTHLLKAWLSPGAAAKGGRSPAKQYDIT